MFKIYNPETRRLTPTGRVLAAAGIGAGTLKLATGCGILDVKPGQHTIERKELPEITDSPTFVFPPNESDTTPPTATQAPAEASPTPHAAPSPTHTRTHAAPSPTHKAGGNDGNNAHATSYHAGGFAPLDGCGAHSASNPGKIYKDANGRPLVVIDARDSRPRDCDPATDIGAGAYQGASYDSGAATLSNGGTHFKDGELVEVVGAYNGERACNSDGTTSSSVWLELADPGKPSSTVVVPAVNTEFTAAWQLQEYGIGLQASQYGDTVTGGC